MKLLAYLINFFWNTIFSNVPSHFLRYLTLKYLFNAKLDRGVSIGRSVKIFHPWKLVVSHGSNIQYKSFIDCRGGVFIGSNVDITMFVKVLSQDHDVMSKEYKTRDRKVTISDDSIIGSCAIVLPGTTIGRGSVIGAGCCIAGAAKEDGVYVGNPARMIKKRTGPHEYNVAYRRPFH
jgi:putative colanic acid biosynthesis acetyltransferase WcaF